MPKEREKYSLVLKYCIDQQINVTQFFTAYADLASSKNITGRKP